MGRKILLVEDDESIAELVEFRLRREGFEVEHLSDGEQAMARIESGPVPDLVISDLMMPFHSGFELVVAMRRNDAWKHLPIILLTSMGNEQDVVRGLELGADEYLTEPFRPAELSARVQRLLSKSSGA